MRRLLLALGLLLIAGTADAATRFAVHTGGATSGDCTGTPCTVERLKAVLVAGDTAILVGSGDLNAPNVFKGTSGVFGSLTLAGTQAAPITIKCGTLAGADDDGGCLIDGEHQRAPLSLGAGAAWLRFHGLNSARGAGGALFITGAQDIEFHRHIVWDGISGDATGIKNNHVISITGGSQRIHFYDLGAFGVGRKVFSHSQNASGQIVECHRCWIRYEGHESGGAAATLRYRSFGTKYVDTLINYDRTQVITTGTLGIGMINDSRAGVTDCANAAMLGVLVYVGQTDVLASPSGHAGVRLGARDTDHDIDCTLLDHVAVVFHPQNPDFGIVRGFTLTDASPVGGAYENLVARNLLSVANSNILDPLPGWTTQNWVQRTTLPAVGAADHPWIGTQGAKLCHRYGTNQPLWPWPMNARIKAATGYAGPYSGTCFNAANCLRGARPAIDVTAQLEALLGPIPAECRTDGGGGGTPPPTVTGAIVEYLIDAADETAGTTIEDHSTEGTDLDLDLVVE